MKYRVSIGYKNFDFANDHCAMYFAQLAHKHAVGGERVTIELIPDNEFEGDEIEIIDKEDLSLND